MRRVLVVTMVAVVSLGSMGCFIQPYSSDKNTRTQELLVQSEDLRQVQSEWRRFWFLDQPSHLTPNRVHGGIEPVP